MLLALALWLQGGPEDLYLAGRFAEARQAIRAEIESGKATDKTFFWLGYTCLALGDKPGAIEPFETYLSSNPKDEDVLYALARTYAQLAEMSLERIFALDPKSARAWQMRGVRFELEKDWDNALNAYAEALRINPGLRGVWSSIARIREKELGDAAKARDAAAKEPGGKPASKGVELLEAGQPGRALPHLMAWRAASPDSPDPYYYLGEAYTDLKVAAIRRLREANPSSYRLHQVLAENYASIHKREEAIAEYREVLKLEPAAPGVRYDLARLLTDSAPDEARRLLEEELAIDAGHYLARSLLGQLLAAMHESEKAAPLLESALAQRPSLTGARRALGKVLLDLGKPAEARPHLARVAEENPDDEQVHFLLARYYKAVGKPEEEAREMAIHREILRKLAGR